MIARLLSRAVPRDPVEREHLAAMWALSRAEGCRDREHYAPGHFTASAFVLSPDGGSLALIHHGKLNRWLQPGGHVEPADEDLLAAARREVAEEIGLTGLTLLGPEPFDLDVHAIPARADQPSHKHFDVRFLFQADTDGLRAGSDARAARWVPLNEVSAHESDASVMRAVGKILSR